MNDEKQNYEKKIEKVFIRNRISRQQIHRYVSFDESVDDVLKFYMQYRRQNIAEVDSI